MDPISIFVHDAENRLFTVKQKIEFLKGKHKEQENKLTQKISVDEISGGNTAKRALRENNHQIDQPRKTSQYDLNEIDKQSMSLFHNDFKSLLDEKLKEEISESNVVTESKPTKHQNFLRKGEGLSAKQPSRESNHQISRPRKTSQSDLVKIAIDDQPLSPFHQDFKSLLDEKLREETCESNVAAEPRPIKTRTFLRKGEGLSRFRMKPEDFKLNKRVRPPKTHSAPVNTESNEKESILANLCALKENSSLKAFELLEQQTNDSSFSPSSSVVGQLMEDSIKSTPIKVVENTFVDCCSGPHSTKVNGEIDFFGIRSLDVIDEEPSKFDESFRYSAQSSQALENDDCKLIIVKVSDDEKYQQNSGDEEFYNSSDCSSRCSCCLDEETSHLTTSKSVSVFTEKTTTVFSPAKSECTREVQFYEAATEESNSRGGESESHLKTLLQTRLRELESEIDAFRHENSHLIKLRENYETEYSKFCDEKMQLLAKIRAEHLQNIREIEEEKKKLTREKTAFEKYMKEVAKKPNKQEKEEIRLLKEEIKLLKDEISKKESRWGAAQARIRTEMKQLKDLNASLKDEIKELKTKKVTFAPVIKKSKPPKTVKYERCTQSLEVGSDLINSTHDLLQQLEFSDTKYIDKVRSLASSLELSDPTSNRSICVSSYLNNSQIESNGSSDVNTSTVVKEFYDENGNIEKSFPDGRKEIWYANGNIKKISADGRVSKIIYFNGDVKEILENDIVKYYYAESKIWHSEYGNGSKIMEFPDGQIEKRYKDGSLNITYPNGTIYEVNAEGEEKWTQADGTIIIKNKLSDEKRLIFPNGQVEIHTPEYKRREYPDGTVKTVYVDGRQETKYWNGRIRLKTKNGTLLSDTEVT